MRPFSNGAMQQRSNLTCVMSSSMTAHSVSDCVATCGSLKHIRSLVNTCEYLVRTDRDAGRWLQKSACASVRADTLASNAALRPRREGMRDTKPP